MFMEAMELWILAAMITGASGFFWRYLARMEKRLDRRFDRQDAWIDDRFDRQDARIDERFDRQDERLDGLARDVAVNGRGIARLEGRHEGHPLAVAEQLARAEG